MIPTSISNTGYVSEVLSIMLIEKLQKRKDRDTVSIAFPHKTNASLEGEGLLPVIEELKPLHVFQHTSTNALLEFPSENFAYLFNANSEVWITATGDRDWVRSFIQSNRKVIEKRSFIRWHYFNRQQNGISSRDFSVKEPLPVYDEFYPFIEGGIEKYFDQYFASSASILMMAGEPGTGKTSLIRWLIWKRLLNAQVTFDDVVMSSECYYLDYLCSDRFNLLVLEDADLLLTSRTSDQNKLMTKLLNVSDGIVKLVQKKMILSTNLNLHSIDPALIRSGRCFDVLHFRHLNQIEAEAAALKAGLPNKHFAKEVTLAELFHGQQKKDNLRFLKMA